MANFYIVEQRGVPGARLIEAERPASAINHVTEGAFTVKRVDGRDLLDAAKLYEVEVAGVKPTPAEPAAANPAPVENDPRPAINDTQTDFEPGTGSNEEDEE